MPGTFVQQCDNGLAANAALASVIAGTAVASASQTVANPGVFTTASQSYTAGTPVYLTGTAPGGFSLGTVYWIIAAGLSSTTLQLSATQGGAGIQCTASAACTVNPTIKTTAGNSIIVISSQHPASTATLTDTLGESWIALPGGGIFGDGLFAYVCQNSIGGANIITAHSNSANLSSVAAWEYSGLMQSGGVAASMVLGQNGPGLTTDAVTPGPASIGLVPCMLFGFSCDYNSGAVPIAGTGFTGRGAIWSGNTGGSHALAEDRRVTVGGSYSSTFTSPNFSDILVTYFIALPELGAGAPVLLGQNQY